MSLAVDYDNQHILKFIRVWMSPFDFIMIPDKYLPSKMTQIWSKKRDDKTKYDQAGFKIKNSVFQQGALLL